MATVLLTGARAPATLELARLLHSFGHRVVVAESLPRSLASGSRAVARSYPLPWPRRDRAAYGRALEQIVQRERVDMFVPTTEEVFHVALVREPLESICAIFAPATDVLLSLHSKARFVDLMRTAGVPVPETERVAHGDQLRAVFEAAERTGRRLAIKPEWSRFATYAALGATARDIARIKPTEAEPWVVQTFLPGPQICTFSVAVRGHIVAHTAYRTEFTAGVGATVAFEHVDHIEARQHAERAVAHTNLTGMLGLDFIDTRDGLVAIEANPRVTSGMHLLARDPACAEAVVSAMTSGAATASRQVGAIPDATRSDTAPLQPQPAAPVMVGSGLALVTLLSLGRPPKARAMWNAFERCADVVYDRDDPWPAVQQLVQLVQMLWWVVRHRASLRDATTIDMEYNGEA